MTKGGGQDIWVTGRATRGGDGVVRRVVASMERCRQGGSCLTGRVTRMVTRLVTRMQTGGGNRVVVTRMVTGGGSGGGEKDGDKPEAGVIISKKDRERYIYIYIYVYIYIYI